MTVDVFAMARSVGDVLRDAGAEAERERRLPERAARAMAKAGLYRLSVAQAFGGYEVDPASLIAAIDAVAIVEAAAGWNLMIALEVAGIASGHLDEEGGAAIWGADPEAIMSGALRASARATPVDGGWEVTGRWPFASGCHNAGWFWGGAQLLDADGNAVLAADGAPRTAQLCMPLERMTIIDTWNVAGLRGSGSHDVAAERVFVPPWLVTDVYGSPPRQTGPLFTYPLVSRLAFTKIGVATGIARAAIDAFVALASEKTPYTAATLLRERPQAQLAIAEAEALLGSGRAFVNDAVGAMWAEVCAGREPSRELRIRQRLASSYCTDACVRAVDVLVRAAGSTANFLDSPLERHARDIRAVQAHVTVAPAVFETAGRALLGMPVKPGSF